MRRRGVALLITCVAAAALPPTLRAQSNGGDARRLVAVRITAASPVVDGLLDDEIWASAPPQSDFLQLAPFPGAPATERTEARVAYDDAAIYIALRMFDSRPDSIFARVTRRDDATATADRVSVYIDSQHDRRTAVMFTTTPRGSRSDVQLFNDNSQDPNWDAVWDVATRVDSLGWTAEFRIPFSQLRFSTNDGGALVWGIQFRRELARRDETSYWAPVPPNAGRTVSLFGELHGLEALRPSRNFEIAPYVVSRVTRAPGNAGNPFHRSTAVGQGAGADLKVGLTSNFTLTATLNPDFGQVEADPSRVNLSAFEQSYPEKRPFFTEGAEIFRFPTMAPEGSVFYSRRVGRPPQRPLVSPRGGYADNPATTQVLGAAKLAGKTASGWSLGALSALTAQETASMADSLGGLASATVEPLTHYGVVRVSRNLRGGQSGLGLIATATNRKLGDDPRLLVLRRSAYALGIDTRHRFRRQFEIAGWVVGSSLHGDTAAIAATQRNAVHRFQRPDATHLTYDPTLTSMQGWAGEFSIRRIGGTGLTWAFFSGARSPGVDVNDGGFQTYTDVWYLYGDVTYRRNTPGRHVRSWNVGATFVPAWSFGMETNQIESRTNAAVHFMSGWTAGVNLLRRESALSPPELRGGPALRYGGTTQATLNFGSDARRDISASLQVVGRVHDEEAARLLEGGTTVNVRASPRATFSLAPRVSLNRSADQYIRTVSVAGAPRYILGAIEQTTASLTGRASYVITPTLSLDIYAQPFLSHGSYTALREAVQPRAHAFHERFDTFTGERIAYDAALRRYAIDADADGRTDFFVPDPDFTVRELRTNTVLRWEYRPGSTLYVVWAQSRADARVADALRLDRDFGRVFTSPGTNVLMIKASYWLSR